MSPDALVNLLSRYLARHVGDDELLAELERVDRSRLDPDSAELVGELADELRVPEHGNGFVQVLVRETLESLALHS